MDVLAPELMWLDDKCYRLPILDSKFSSDDTCYKEFDAEEQDNVPEECEEYAEDCPPIEVLPNGRHRMFLPVARSFVPFIIGSKGCTIKRITNETSCSIIVPKVYEEQKLKIVGPNRRKVTLAWSSILFVIRSNRKKLSMTHFVSIPLTGEEIQKNMKTFKEEVLDKCPGRGINDKIFQNPARLHLTLTPLVLADDAERKLAVEKFRELLDGTIRPMIDGKKPLVLEVSTLDIMNDDPSQVNVVYANVRIKNHPTLLQEISDEILKRFKGLDFAKEDEKDAVKIHATILNAKFQLEGTEEEEEESAKRPQNASKQKCDAFDATNIIKMFENFDFGQQELKTIHLSTRFTTDENGYYKHLAMAEL